MIPVTQQYKDAVYANSRKTAGKVIFQIVDTSADADITDETYNNIIPNPSMLGVPYTNGVVNGDMSDGTTGWVHYGSYSVETIVSGRLRSTKDSNRPYVGRPLNGVSGHVMYTSFYALGNKSGNLRIIYEDTFGNTPLSSYMPSITTSLQKYSYIGTLSGGTTYITFDGISFDSAADYIEIDDVFSVDLTDLFGSSIPSQTWCDLYLPFVLATSTAVFPTSWTPSGAYHIAEGGVLKNYMDGSSSFGIEETTTSIPVVAGHQYFVICRARVISTSCFVLSCGLYGSTVAGLQTVFQQATPVQNQWYPISAIVPLTTSTGFVKFRMVQQYAGPQTGKVMEFTEPMVVDISTDFGFGMEPDIIYCKLNMPFILASATLDQFVTGEELFSKKAQMFDSNVNMSAKYATFENDYWVLDGSFVLPPKPTETLYQVGWWSADLSGADGSFAAGQGVAVEFASDHTSIGITIVFDPLTDEYADDFVITVFDSAGAVIHTETVTGNLLSTYILQHTLTNYRKVTVAISSWAHPYRRARITELGFGIIQEYDGVKLVSLNVLEEIDSLSNITSSNEVKFSVDNKNKAFNILNPSGIYPYLQRRQKIEPFLGVQKIDTSFEYVRMGTYYLTEWRSDEDALTATFSARDILDVISQDPYRKGVYQSRTLYNLAIDVLTDAGVTDYSVDAALSAITAVGCIPIVSHREALQMISMAGKAVMYSDRYGSLIIKQLSAVPIAETIALHDMFKSPQIKLDKLVNIVEVAVNKYNAQGSTSEVYKGTIAISGTVDVWIEYSTGPCQSVSSVVTGGTVNSETYYGNAALLNITAAGNVTITSTGTVLDKSATIYRLVDPAAPVGEQALTVKSDNPLISDNTMADNVADWILAEYQKRFLYEINWRGNPALECGDIVTVEDGYGENKTVMLLKQDFNFAGYLESRPANGRG